jgi:hypothetical protein
MDQSLFVFCEMGGSDSQIEFWQAREIIEDDRNRIYTTADPYYISESIAVNPAKAQVVAHSGVGENVALYRARALGEDADAWWYYLEREGKPYVIDPYSPNPKEADALRLGQEELRQILEADLREITEKGAGQRESASKAKKSMQLKLNN